VQTIIPLLYPICDFDYRLSRPASDSNSVFSLAWKEISLTFSLIGLAFENKVKSTVNISLRLSPHELDIMTVVNLALLKLLFKVT